MNVSFVLYGQFREAAGEKHHEVDVQLGDTVAEALTALVTIHPELESKLFAADGKVKDAAVIIRNGKNINQVDGMETGLESGDEIQIVHQVAGG